MSEGTGWPGCVAEADAYNQHANVKLTQEQLDHIMGSDEPISQWIRDAIQQRIDREGAKKHYPAPPTGIRSDGEWAK